LGDLDGDAVDIRSTSGKKWPESADIPGYTEDILKPEGKLK
jgi:hypothetical protein